MTPPNAAMAPQRNQTCKLNKHACPQTSACFSCVLGWSFLPSSIVGRSCDCRSLLVSFGAVGTVTPRGTRVRLPWRATAGARAPALARLCARLARWSGDPSTISRRSFPRCLLWRVRARRISHYHIFGWIFGRVVGESRRGRWGSRHTRAPAHELRLLVGHL